MSSDKMTDIYEEQLAAHENSMKRRMMSKIITRGKDVRMGPSRQGRVAYLVEPSLGFDTKTIHLFISEIFPGRHSGKHRHLVDAIIYILSGRGYTVIEDERYDWEAGDALFVPPWTWHQHFNSSESEPVKYLGVVSVPLMRNLGLLRIEQAEDTDSNYDKKRSVS